MNATIEQLAKAFDCKPDFGECEDEQPYAFATFRTSSGDVDISFRVLAPIGEFQFRASRLGKVFFDMQSSTSSVVKVDIFENKHLLVIEDGDRTITYIRLKPDFFVGHEIKGH